MARRIIMQLVLFLCSWALLACAPVAAPVPNEPAASTPATDEPTTSTPAATAPEKTVVLLVVDKFSEKDKEKETDEPPQGNCIIDTNGTGYTSGGGGTDLEHGERVVSTITDFLQVQLSAILIEGSDDSQLWEVPAYGNIKVVRVDIKEFDTDLVASAIREGIAKESPVIDFVINMSWAIFPQNNCRPSSPDEYLEKICETRTPEDTIQLDALEDVKALLATLSRTSVDDLCENRSAIAQDYTLDQLRGSSLSRLWLRSLYENPDFRSSLDNLGNEPAADPLGELIAELQPGDELTPGELRVISVAAAGNDKLAFPYIPAYWDSVVSVSASSGGNTTWDNALKAPYSNSGEVMMSGVHPHVTDAYGSSFAAPRFSILAALYLLQGGELPCQTPPSNPPVVPVLGYISEIGDWQSPPADYDLPVDTAADKYCQPFLSLVQSVLP